jgi:hypothetical protein
MILKDSSVNLQSVNWRLFRAAIIAEHIYEMIAGREYELIITSANDGTHKPRDGMVSLHYVGLALDFRIHDLPQDLWHKIRDTLADRLGPDFVVILEVDHIHIQYKRRADYDAAISRGETFT